jgi:thiol-disulfide isomerase/thioredoxin
VDDISIPEIDKVRYEKGLWLADRLPFPELIYSDEKGRSESTREFIGKPFLVNLWASWCEDCMQEMSEFSENQENIRGLGATILALNVDGLTTDNQETASLDGWAELSQLGYQLDSGKARPENLGKMEILLEFLTSRRQPLSIPTSFLVDSKGEVAAIYQGIVSCKQIISDLALLKARGQDQLSRLSPRPGRWFENPLTQNSKTRLGDYSTLFARNGFPAEAEYLLQLPIHLKRQPLLKSFITELK